MDEKVVSLSNITLRQVISKHALAKLVGREMLTIDKVYIETKRLDVVTPWSFIEIGRNGKEKLNLGPQLVICNKKLSLMLQYYSSKASTLDAVINYEDELRSQGYIWIE